MGLINSLYSLQLRHSVEELFGHDGYEKSVIKIDGSTVFVYTVDLHALEKWSCTKYAAKASQISDAILNCGYAFSTSNIAILSKHINKFDRNVLMWHEIGHIVNKHTSFTPFDILKAFFGKRSKIVNNGVWEKIADKMAYQHTGVKITPTFLVNMLKLTTLNYLEDREAVNEIFSPEKEQLMMSELLQCGRFN